MKLKQIKIDAARAERGAWVDKLPDMGDLRLKVRGFSNSDFSRMLAAENTAVPRSERKDGRIDPATLDQIMARCMARHILVDWDGLEGDDGEAIPYSEDLALQLLTDPNFRLFREAVAVAAQRVEQVEEDQVQAVEGNSASA